MNHAKYLLKTLMVYLPFLVAVSAKAAGLPEPSDTLLYGLKESMVKVGTTTRSGGHGFGTGVAVTKDHVVTNCCSASTILSSSATIILSS